MRKSFLMSLASFILVSASLYPCPPCDTPSRPARPEVVRQIEKMELPELELAGIWGDADWLPAEDAFAQQRWREVALTEALDAQTFKDAFRVFELSPSGTAHNIAMAKSIDFCHGDECRQVYPIASLSSRQKKLVLTKWREGFRRDIAHPDATYFQMQKWWENRPPGIKEQELRPLLPRMVRLVPSQWEAVWLAKEIPQRVGFVSLREELYRRWRGYSSQEIATAQRKGDLVSAKNAYDASPPSSPEEQQALKHWKTVCTHKLEKLVEQRHPNCWDFVGLSGECPREMESQIFCEKSRAGYCGSCPNVV